MKENYGVRGHFTNKYTHYELNVVSHLRNVLVSVIHERILLPKFMVIVPDDDLIKFLANKATSNEAYRKILGAIMKQHNCYITTQKEWLPTKSKKGRLFPQIIWIDPPLHDNFVNNQTRNHFNRMLNETVKYHFNTISLGLRQVWDHSDTCLYIKESRHYTNLGLNSY